METQGSESPRGDISSSRRVLKMQTIPTETPERKRSTQQSFETDDKFQFRRHSAKKSRFGDRLQEFQSVKDARRVENFNSSFQVPPQSQEEHQQYTGQAFPPQYPAPTQLPSPQRMIPMPMVYYYAAANQQPGAVPAGTQPQQYAIPQQGMGINFQAMNQFIDPQYQEQQPYYQSLMPAPSFYPPPSSQEKLPNPLSQNRPILAPEDSRAKRKSFMIQRGRRLSLLNQENQLNDIISPHKDVHESEFYRYMNNSFAQDLKMKQLMNWCLIRALRKLEIKNSQNKSESRKITLTILKDFVRDIRKGSHDIDWDSEGPEAEPTVEDESEISNLFKEGNTENSILVDSSLSNKNKIPPIKLAKIPNEKNIQNKENAKILEEKIKTIKNEIEQWSKDLSDVKIPSYELPKSQTSIVKLPDNLQLTATTKESIHSDFQKRVDGLQETTRLLKSSSILLNETAGMKLQRLNGCIVKKRPEDKNSTKKLLRGLSRSLMQ